MKKQKLRRLYHLSDAKLIATAKEKIGFIRRDAKAFLTFGIRSEMIAELENTINIFSDLPTDIESKSEQAIFTQARDLKSEELRVAIRNVMLRVQMTFDIKSSRYKAFGAGRISKQRGANLLTVGKTVVKTGTESLSELEDNGVTVEMLAHIDSLCNELENLILDQELKVSHRYVLYEKRVEMGNSIYAKLMNYTSIGMSIWETSSPAKYNDYVVYTKSKKAVSAVE